MSRWLVCGLVLATVACGRIGFEPRAIDATADPDGSASGGDSGAIGDGALVDSPNGTCGYQVCNGTDEACCVGTAASCAPNGTCAGQVYACNALSCGTGKHCCTVTGGGSLCLNIATACSTL